MSAILAFLFTRLAGAASGRLANLARVLLNLKGGRRIVAPASPRSRQDRRTLVRGRRDIVLAEIAESRLTRSWRPALMFLLMAFLLLFGFVIPCTEMVTGRRLDFEPRLALLPDAVWNLLAIGLGGYIGGRSVEKIAGRLWARNEGRPRRSKSRARR